MPGFEGTWNELESLVDILLKVTKVFLKQRNLLSEANVDYFEQLGKYILCAKSNIINPEIELIEKFNYNWVSIDKMNFDVNPSEVKRSDKEIPFRFFHDLEQKKQIKNALALHPNNPTGAPLIYNQNLKMLYRNFDFLSPWEGGNLPGYEKAEN